MCNIPTSGVALRASPEHFKQHDILRFPHDLDIVIDEHGGVYAIAHLTMHENHNWKSNHRNITHYESQKRQLMSVSSVF